MISPPPLSMVLPRTASEILRRAAQTPIPPDDPLARVIAIERATERVKRLYPSYFQPEYY